MVAKFCLPVSARSFEITPPEGLARWLMNARTALFDPGVDQVEIDLTTGFFGLFFWAMLAVLALALCSEVRKHRTVTEVEMKPRNKNARNTRQFAIGR